MCCGGWAGIATSLKVLFAAEDCSGAATQEPQLRLERNEVIPLCTYITVLPTCTQTCTPRPSLQCMHARGLRLSAELQVANVSAILQIAALTACAGLRMHL